MATRLYVPSFFAGRGAVPHSSWDWQPGDFLQRGLVATKKGWANATKTVAPPLGYTSAKNLLLAQFVTAPLASQTVSGNIKGQIRVSESSTAADAMAQILVRLVDSTGAHKSILLATHTSSLASEISTSVQNRKFPQGGSTALTSQSAAAGDRIVIEVGVRALNTTGTAYSYVIGYGDGAGVDLAEDETTTTANDAWFEFSNTLSWVTDGDTHDHGLTTMDENANVATDKVDVFGERGARVLVGQTFPRGKEYQT